MRLRIDDPDEMHRFGVRLGRLLGAGDLVLLTGPLGAGKTTLTRGIGEGLGVRGPVQSPTFVLARTHPSLVGGAPLVHVDAYRLGALGGESGGGADELDDLDLDFEASVVVAEWGAGVVGVRDSWIEVVIERPRGAGADAGAGAGAGADAGADDAALGAGGAADAEPDWGETLVESRSVTVTGHGPRWSAGSGDPLASIEAAARSGGADDAEEPRDAGGELR
ncbi:tRNA (adenosine(37)-N6)-threonylcarbamoyltransferase complex ATPase subunit type 1 TsaE [Leucobacter chironomi]|uniref:tRNA (adenosine(37)-N6)-threonylcarbamoyltransferase complex ATPase subunit type 1 TsaE n=1 Tax=Leucobacter chironomi TaxID=491918 RepID=UPI00040841EB